MNLPASFQDIPIDDTGLMLPPSPSLRQGIKDTAYLARAAFNSTLGQINSVAEELADEIDWHDWQPGRPTILCLSRATFNKDVDEMRRRTALNLVSLKATKIKHAQEAWVPPEWRVQTYFTGLLNNELAAFRPYLIEFGCALLRAAARRHPIDAMLAANSDYWQDEALRLAGKELNVPFLTLCRENYTIPFDQRTIAVRYTAARFRYTGTAAVFYSEATKRVVEATGSYRPGTIEVTGAPRFDRWRDIASRPMEERDCITLVSYAYPIYQAMRNFADVASVFADLSLEYPSLTFVLKLKKQNEDIDALTLCPKLSSSRVKFVADWPLFDLLPRSRVVIGCNSLAIAEGLLADVPVVTPAWADALSDPATCLYHPSNERHATCFYFPQSTDEFTGLLWQATAGRLATLGTRRQREACFSDHIFFPETGSSSGLVEDFICRYLSSPETGSSVSSARSEIS